REGVAHRADGLLSRPRRGQRHRAAAVESRKPPHHRGAGHAVIRFGPAGWTYPDYPGHVYPADAPKKFDVLAFLARYYDTIEINASFYAPQPARNFASWVKRVAHNEKFRFTAKLWQKFTHGIAAYGRHDEAAYADAMKNRGAGTGERG